MRKLHLNPTGLTPGILLDPDQNRYIIRGNSRPEDVRELYFPVIEWLADFRKLLLSDDHSGFTEENPFVMQFDLVYFNSSTAKFLFDIIHEFRQMKECGIPIAIIWHYDEEDIDMKEAGENLSYLAELEFIYLKK